MILKSSKSTNNSLKYTHIVYMFFFGGHFGRYVARFKFLISKIWYNNNWWWDMVTKSSYYHFTWNLTKIIIHKLLWTAHFAHIGDLSAAIFKSPIAATRGLGQISSRQIWIPHTQIRLKHPSKDNCTILQTQMSYNSYYLCVAAIGLGLKVDPFDPLFKFDQICPNIPVKN